VSGGRARDAQAQAAPKAIVFDVQRFSIHDGPGIRTVVFFKGCALDCRWCHNPEAVRRGPELAYHAERCVAGCNDCLDACPEGALVDRVENRVDFALCTHCGACVDPCPSGALEQIGREVGVDELIVDVLRDRSFFDAAGGGVTVSGGEPLMHSVFLERFLERLHGLGVHTCAETAGGVPYEALERLLPWVDLVLFDVKVIDAEAHRRFTGHGNDGIHRGLERLLASGTPVQVRMPVVPGCNTDDANVAATCALLRRMGVGEITLLPYNALWEAKLAALDTHRRALGIRSPDAAFYEDLRAAFARGGIAVRA
jgi:pyruvate formate lyase activating enzyme